MMGYGRNLAVGTYNVRGLALKEQLVLGWIQSSKLAVAALTETWINPSEQVADFISEYVALSPRARNGKGYGAAALCIHPLVKYQTCERRNHYISVHCNHNPRYHHRGSISFTRSNCKASKAVSPTNRGHGLSPLDHNGGF